MATKKQQTSAVTRLALNRREAASALGVSASTIDRLTATGELKPSRACRRPLYSVSEIERFLRDTTAKIPSGNSLDIL